MSSSGSYLLQSFLTLVVVTGLAVVVLWGARRMGVGRPHGPMQLVGRLPLEARRALYLVRVADQVLLVGSSEAGLTKLAEVNPERLELGPPEPEPLGFADILSRIRSKREDANTEKRDEV